MRTQMIAALSMSLLAAGHAGCWVEPDPDMNEPDVDIDVPGLECPDSVLPVVIQHDQVCKPEDCGTNTPHVHGLAFDGLYVNGKSSNQGFRILGFTKGDHEGVISVNNGLFQATLTDGTVTAAVGGSIKLEWLHSTGCTKRYDLKIMELHHSSGWRGDERIPVYRIYALDKTKFRSEKPICKKDDGEETHAVLLVNERYNVDDAKVLGTEPNWFTIACEGSALYKMRFAGYDPEVSTGALSSTPQERQATLKMITADYCGDAESSFTEVGTPVRWQDRYGWCSSVPGICPYFPVDTEIESREAIWGPEGALCLDNPRLGKDVDCGSTKEIPLCGNNTMAKLGGHWETFNPISTP
jgi:hypothetical protein